ncbi:Tas Predicted oxidoreductases (related to aryl-alcohol dehydrogenases) [Candidatus Nanopelagicaceae bacterium]
MKIILGTANFGLDYGSTESSKRLSMSGVSQILNCAELNGISAFDTAVGYGVAQEVLRSSVRNSNLCEYTTKIDSRKIASKEQLLEEVSQVCERLGIHHLYSVLLHDSSNLAKPDVIESFEYLVNSGYCKKVGVSIYDNYEFQVARRHANLYQIIQLPNNLLSRNRFSESELSEVAMCGVEIQIRSVFLQGALLNAQATLKSVHLRQSKAIREFHQVCKDLEMNELDILLNFVKTRPWAQSMVIGVDSANQLQDIVNSLKSDFQIDFEIFPELDSWIQDPRNWS